MKFILKLFLYILLFVVSFLIFFPKEGLYNLLEEKLSKQNIVLSDEIREEKPFSLNLSKMNIYYDGIYSAHLKDTDISTYLIYSNVLIKDIKVADSFKNLVPNKIKNINLEHSLISFDKVNITSNGDFGSFEGEYFIFENKIIGELKPSKIMKSRYRNILREFKLKDGRYYYEYKF